MNGDWVRRRMAEISLPSGPMAPSVPMLAARRPSVVQIWRRKSTVELAIRAGNGDDGLRLLCVKRCGFCEGKARLFALNPNGLADICRAFVGQNGDGSGFDRHVNEVLTIMCHTFQRGEQSPASPAVNRLSCL